MAKDWTQDETIRMLEKEIERLREALVKIALDIEGDYDFLVWIAKDALKEKE